MAPIVGARTPAQLDDNLGVFDVTLEPEHRARLAEASAVDLGFRMSPCAASVTRIRTSWTSASGSPSTTPASAGRLIVEWAAAAERARFLDARQ
ncbi:MAG TPA: hypothetical protein VH912_14095 [Streptosporangiaceae bacterium]